MLGTECRGGSERPRSPNSTGHERARSGNVTEARERVCSMKFERVADVAEFVDGGRRTVDIAGRRVAVFRVGDSFHALDDLCRLALGRRRQDAESDADSAQYDRDT